VLEGEGEARGARLLVRRRDLVRARVDVDVFAGDRRAAAGVPPWEALLDAERAGTTLRIRSARPTDRFVPLGRDQETPVLEFLAKQGLPGVLRRGVRVAEAAGGIAWVLGRRIDARFAVTAGTRRVATLYASPIAP
jgi:tRNA(Ile)-lysidine synthase